MQASFLFPVNLLETGEVVLRRPLDPQLEELMRFTLAAAKPIHTDHPQDLASARGFLSHAPWAGLKKNNKKTKN